MNLVPLGRADAHLLVSLARRPEVVRFGEHTATDGAEVWEPWLAPEPHGRIAVGAFAGDGSLSCAVRLTPLTHRRRVHVATLDVIAPWDGLDDDLHAALGAVIDTADRWLAVRRIEARAPAGHPRVAGLFARHGLVLEATERQAIERDGVLQDEVSLARLQGESHYAGPVASAPSPPPRRPPPTVVTFRAVTPDDAVSWTRAISHEAVIWGTLQLPWQHPEVWAKRHAGEDAHVISLGVEADGELAGGGALVLHPATRRRHVATLGMFIFPHHHGRGLGGQLAAELCARAARLGRTRVELHVFDDNTRACRLYERVGFAHEGRRRLACVRDGAFVDDLAMAWLAPRAACP